MPQPQENGQGVACGFLRRNNLKEGGFVRREAPPEGECFVVDEAGNFPVDESGNKATGP